MRSQLLNAVSGALGLATLAVAAPAVSYGGSGSCALSASTVFVTVSQHLTVTIHDAPTSYVTLGLSELSTITLTRTNTLYSTTSTTLEPHTETISLSLNAATSTNAAAINTPSYESTVWETVFATVTNVQLSAASSGGSLTYSETAASNGLLTFVVENGTTYWLNGQTPPPTASYVVQTSVVTVLPVITPITKLPDTSTLTLISTLYNTLPLTITETLVPANISSQTFTASSFGTAATPTRSGWGGWNATSAVGGALGTGAHQFTTLTSGTFDPYNTVSFITEESTLDIYHHPTTAYTLPSYAAKSGFNALSSPSAIENSHSTSTSSTTAYLTVTPFLNSTTSTLGVPLYTSQSIVTSSSTAAYSTSRPVSSTNSALGNFTSSGPDASSSITATTVSKTSSSTYTGEISSFWTSQPIATLPINYTSVLSSSKSTSTLSSASTPSAVSTLSSSTSIVGSFSVTSQAYIIPSTTSSQTTTSISSIKSAIPSLCSSGPGEYGDFTLNFDDIPPMSVGNQNANTTDPEPVFSPYHQFDFSDGWVIVPPPTDPYLPSSPPLLTEFIPNFNLTTSTSQSGPNSAEFGYSGDIGSADHGSLGCFSFNVYGASFGCDSTGPDCVFSFTGFRYENGVATSVVSENSAITACPALANCDLVPITLSPAFQDLDVIRINVTVAGEPKIWWMDDLKLGWTDNSCSAGMCRSGSHIRAVKHI